MSDGNENPNRVERGGRDEESGDERTHQPEPGHPVAGEDVGMPDKESAGSAKADVTPEISGEGQVQGQTTYPAPDDDVGVPEDTGGGDPDTPKDEG